MKQRLVLMTVLLALSICAKAQNKNTDHPKRIILMIGDGMGASQIFAGMTANKGTLNLQQCTAIGFHKSQSADNYITDSAAGATAFACGEKTYNGAIAVDINKKAIPTILEAAEKNGLATGLVATCSITHATPACFIAHQPSRALDEDIAHDFLKTDIDVFIGGGRKFFKERKDGKNLMDSLAARKYQVVNTIEEVEKINKGKLAAFLADEQQVKMSEGRGEQLVTSTEAALRILSQNQKGMFLMIEGSQIDWGGHANDLSYITNEMIDFDHAIGKVLEFAKKDGQTLVIVTADHETGGLSLTGGDISAGKVDGKFTTKDHTGVMIPVFAYGPGAQEFIGIYENTAIFQKMMKAFNFKSPK